MSGGRPDAAGSIFQGVHPISSLRSKGLIDRQLKRITSDQFLPRVLKNVTQLISGNAAALLLGVVTMGILARSLGPAGLGLIVLIESYGKLINQLIKLESWQSFIRYGAIALEGGDTPRFLRLVKFGTALDVGESLLAAAICIAFAGLAGQLFGWTDEAVVMARLYSIALVFGVGSTPLGILRIFDKFATIAWLDPVAAVFRLTFVAIAAAMEAPLMAYLLILIVVQVGQRLVLAMISYRTLRANHFTGFLRQPLRSVARENPGMWPMILSSNATILLRKSTQEVDVLAVGAFMGTASAGIYQIARKLGYALTKAGGTLQQVSFPHLARLWARGEVEKFKKLVMQIEVMTLAGALACSLSLVIFAEPLILLIAGPQYLGATLPLIVHSIATLILLCGSALRPALANMGLQMKVLGIVAASAVAFYATLAITIPNVGIVGASIAHLVANAITLPAIAVLYSRGLRADNRTRIATARDGPADQGPG